MRRGREGGGRKEKEEEEEEEKDEERGGGRREEEEGERRRKRRRRESPKHSLAFDQLKIDQTVSPRQQQENKAPPPAPPPTLQPPAAPFPTAPLRQCLSWLNFQFILFSACTTAKASQTVRRGSPFRRRSPAGSARRR